MSVVYRPNAPWIQNCHLKLWMERLGFSSQEEFFKKAANETEWFWRECLKELGLDFAHESPAPTTQPVLSQGLPFPKWMPGTQISIVQNCIDRHLKDRADETALIFENDTETDSHRWSFRDLYHHSSFIAEELQKAGAKRGDRAALLMPMSLEMVASFFGILRAGLGVIPIFSGYGSEAIAARLQDAKVRFVFVQEKSTRRSKEIPVRETLDSLVPTCPSVEKVFVLKRADFRSGGHRHCGIAPVSTDAEEEVLFLYTSGTTGKPKACVHTPFGVLATCGKEHRFHFDVRKGDRFFWYTDIGWMMGPWELIGALQSAASVVLFEGVPDFPDTDRLWRILDRHQVTHLGISPTAIRVLKKSESEYLKQTSFPHLRILGSTGEPWDEESWLWFFKEVGKSRCPILNISGGTEIMGCLLGPTPLDSLKPAALAKPCLGVNAQVWSEEGQELSQGLGHLVCLSPLPSMTKGFLGNPQKYLDTYFEKFGSQVWYHGDWALKDDDGFWFLKGRSDDTIKVAGKRVGPNEYESAMMEDDRIQEAAAVGIPHEIKGECVYCFIVLKDPQLDPQPVKSALEERVGRKMGKALSPEKIIFVRSLPKTRSGKILRGLIRKIQLQESFDDSAVENPDSLQAIRESLRV
jgi:acetyl-CoA synthetase